MTKWKKEIKWGVIFVLVQLVWMVLERMAGLHDKLIAQHENYTNLFMIPAIAVYWFAMLDFRKQAGGYISFKRALVSGLVTTLVVTLLTPLSQYLTVAVISPQYFENAIQYSVAQKKYTMAEAEAFFSLKNYLIMSVLFTPVAGIVTSLITALFVSLKKPKKAA